MTIDYKDGNGNIRKAVGTHTGDTGDPDISLESLHAQLLLIKAKTDNLDVALSGVKTGTDKIISAPATAANQAAGNTSLSNIEGYVDGIETAIASTNTKLDTVHTDLGTLLTTGTPITGQSLESGGAGGLGWLSSVRKKLSDLIALLPTALGQTTMANSLAVTIASNQSAVPISDNSGSITVDTADTVIDVTPTMDTSAYAAGDIFFDTTAISSAATANGGTVTLNTITVLDEDDQGPTFQMVFLDTNNSLGTINNPPTISDANSRKIVGTLSSALGTWVDLGGCRVMTITNIGLVMKCDAASSSLYFGSITSTATTQTASGLKFKLGFLR